LCVEMPIHQAKSQVTRAEAHIKQLQSNYANVSKTKVDLTTTFDTFKTAVNVKDANAKVDLALANTRGKVAHDQLVLFSWFK
jgi:DNA-directed RNA polymerase, subunit H (EC 2.7.7.6)